MNYEIDIYSQKFYSSSESIDNLLNRVELFYRYTDNMALSIVIIDSKETEEYITHKIKTFEEQFQIYDMCNFNLKELNNLITSKSLCFINIKKFLDTGIDRIGFYNGFNMSRDDVFLRKNSRFIIIFDGEEYNIFKRHADDLDDYCHIFDFNALFYNNEGININDYYSNEKIKQFIKQYKK